MRPGLRLAVGRSRHGRRARGPLRRRRCCAAAGSSSPRSRTRPRRCSIAAGPTACPSSPPTEARVLRMLDGHDPRPRRRRRRRPARPRRVHRREGRDQRGDGRLQARVPAGRARRGRGRVHRRVQHPRRARHHDAGRSGGHRQRPDPQRHRHELGRQRARPRQPGQRRRSAAPLQLVIRNVGGGRPGEVDRATHGNPGKYTFCFAEDEEGSPWEPLAVERGFAPRHVDGHAVPGRRTALRRRPARRATPESLARIVRRVPAHGAPSEAAARLRRDARRRPRARPRVPRGGLGEERGCGRAPRAACSSPAARSSAAPAASPRACPSTFASSTLPKFRPGGLLIVHAGGGAGLFSAIIGGWANGETGSQPSRRRSDDMSRSHDHRPRSHRRAASRAERRCCSGRRRSTGRTIGLLDISKPRGNVFLDRLEHRLDSGGRTGRTVRQADVHQAGARRPASRDRDEVRRRDRSARRLRVVHVVQCARHRRSGAPGHPVGVRRVDRVRRGRRRPVEGARLLGSGACVRAAPDPGPHRRRDGARTPTRPTRRS